MSIVALSPVLPEPPSPMLTSVTPVTPTLDQDMDHQFQEGTSSPGPGPGTHLVQDPSSRSKKPPPLHTGADWKVVLHLPEIEKWLRSTSERVTQLTHSAAQDSDNRHVDVHLVQLKDICEDISDHVEQIHALLETEFSLKLLSYSVNIIVDIRTVQLLWHQLRVSVLVLKERLLQGLQDSNGNYTRQTDILQAFSQDQHQTRLDALTEVDDCGQLTIRCSQDYFSLDCGITAYELSDYSPSDEPEVQETVADNQSVTQETEAGPGEEPQPDLGSVDLSSSNQEFHNSLPELTTSDRTNHNHSSPTTLLPTVHCGSPSHSQGGKRSLPLGVSHSTEVSPTQPSHPKRSAPPSSDSRTRTQETRGSLKKVSPVSELQLQAELSRSSPSLMDPPDRSKFWLELESVYPENVSQSCENLQMMNRRNLQRNHMISRRSEDQHRKLTEQRSSSVDTQTSEEDRHEQMKKTLEETHFCSEGDSDSSLPSPRREQLPFPDLEASAEESDPRPPPSTTAEVWVMKRHQQKEVPEKEHWYGSEEFLALPAQLHQTEMLTEKLEHLAQSIPLRPGDGQQEALQDVDDWDLTELNPEWDSVGESGDDTGSPLPPLLPSRINLLSRLSPTSSSDMAPSVGESIESGPLSDLQSEDDEGRASVDRQQRTTAPLVDGHGRASLVQVLLEDIQSQDRDPDVWRKIECFVQQLDGFISWLQEALDSTENWTQPRQDLDSLRVYLDTHLSFKLNVDSHSALKENIMEEGRELLTIITSNQSGLKEILHMVSTQWDQLQKQIRRQHGWMLRSLRCVQARLLYTSQSQEPITVTADGLKVELISGQRDAQRAALEQMAIKLSSLRYPSSTSRRQCSQLAKITSLQEFEAEYQELWDWLMDMDAMVVDSHQLMMSEEQRRHLYKSSHTELMMMESRKTNVLGRAESLKRSSIQLPTDFHSKIHNLTHTWSQLEKILSGPGSSQNRLDCGDSLSVSGDSAAEDRRSALSPLTNSLLEQLETRIKELKVWLRDTELLIFNSCLRHDKDAPDQLQSFKSLCAEVRARRRGVASVLKLCQKLLQQSQSGLMAEAAGPEAEQHQEALQLLSINLERRWEAIVMQALQWQNRLKKELGERQVPGNFLEPGLVDLRQISPVPAAPVQDDSWEWDETDMTMTEVEPQVLEPDLTQNLPTEPEWNQRSAAASQSLGESPSETAAQMTNNNNNMVYQVYSLHNVEFYRQPQFTGCSSKGKLGKQKQHLLLKSLSKDSSFSSIESLPDLLGGLASRSGGGGEEDKLIGCVDGEGGRESGQSANSRRSECESGIVSDTGDTETTGNPENPDKDEAKKEKVSRITQAVRVDENKREKGWRKDDSRRNREEEKRRRPRRGGGEALEIIINGRGLLTPPDSDSDFEVERSGGESSKPFVSCKVYPGVGVNSLETPTLSGEPSSPGLSQGSSLESLLASSVDLFPSKETLQRSASLESCLAPGRSNTSSLSELDPRRGGEADLVKSQGEASSGELSRRTLDLLKRLENIQSPLTLDAKMTRSVSDMMLPRISLQHRRLSASPSFGPHSALCGISVSSMRKGPPSLINESSATASLTELSSTEESSLGSEDCALVRNRRRHLLNPAMANASYKKQPAPPVMEEADAASLSMVVNVSACTDEDEDDSDLLSSSTLTLTEEELGVRDGEEEEEVRLSGASSGNEDDEDEDEEEMEGSYVLGLEYIKSELQSWNRSPRTSSTKSESGLRDELQCGSHQTSVFNFSTSFNKEQSCFRNHSSTKSPESGNEVVGGEGDEGNLRKTTRSYLSQFVDDVENGNVDQSCLRRKDDEDDRLLREESSVFIKKEELQRELYFFDKSGELPEDVDSTKTKPNSTRPPTLSVRRGCSLIGQLQGEIPCHSTSFPSPPSLSPVDDCRSHNAFHNDRAGSSERKAITIQEKFKFSTLVTEETRKEIRDKDSSLPPKKQRGCRPSCHLHLPPSSSTPSCSAKKENVHDFVMEIIDLTSLALKSKENQSEENNQSESNGSNQDQSQGPVANIRDKVLEHSHRPLHLRKGDFYSYLSLSSHDSDCGEVSQCSEEKSSTPAPYTIPTYVSPTQGLHSPSPELFTSTNRKTAASLSPQSAHSPPSSVPPSPDIRDEETLFAACTEEVYLGPPLCYSMTLTRKSRSASYPPGPMSKPVDDLADLSPPEEFIPDQELLYFQGSSPTVKTEGTLSSSSPLLNPTPGSISSPAADFTCDDPPSSPPVSRRPVQDLHLLRDVTGREVAAAESRREESRNEGPPYLNPCQRVASSSTSSSAAQRLADTKTLESDTDAVMTKISVCSSATNPSKEPAAATRANPKINCSPMRETDREKGRRGRSSSQQEVKTMPVSHETGAGAVCGRSQPSVRHAPSKTGSFSRLPVLRAGTSRIHL